MPVLQKKICLIGEFAVGKTSLIRRFVEDRFDDKYLSTIGTKISRKSVSLNSNLQTTDINLLIWDLAGSEKFTAMLNNYYRGAAGAILVGDLTRPETINLLPSHAQLFFKVVPRNTPLIFVGNKADLVKTTEVQDKLAQVAEEYQVPWFISSAKTDVNVENIFLNLSKLILHAS